MTEWDTPPRAFYDLFPVLDKGNFAGAECLCGRIFNDPIHYSMWHPWVTLESCILIMNDKHGYTREQIAAWIDDLGIDITAKGSVE